MPTPETLGPALTHWERLSHVTFWPLAGGPLVSLRLAHDALRASASTDTTGFFLSSMF